MGNEKKKKKKRFLLSIIKSSCVIYGLYIGFLSFFFPFFFQLKLSGESPLCWINWCNHFFSSGSNYDIWMCLVAKKMKENERKWDRKRRKRYEPGCASGFSIVCVFFHK